MPFGIGGREAADKKDKKLFASMKESGERFTAEGSVKSFGSGLLGMVFNPNIQRDPRKRAELWKFHEKRAKDKNARLDSDDFDSFHGGRIKGGGGGAPAQSRTALGSTARGTASLGASQRKRRSGALVTGTLSPATVGKKTLLGR